MDKLKKLYDSSKRKIGEIGTYNIGLKALLKIGGTDYSSKNQIQMILYIVILIVLRLLLCNVRISKLY